jgi:hypothetical protein
MFKKCRLNVSQFVKQVYIDCFGKPLELNSKSWIQSLVCKSCVESLRLWTNKKNIYFLVQNPSNLLPVIFVL